MERRVGLVFCGNVKTYKKTYKFPECYVERKEEKNFSIYCVLIKIKFIGFKQYLLCIFVYFKKLTSEK